MRVRRTESAHPEACFQSDGGSRGHLVRPNYETELGLPERPHCTEWASNLREPQTLPARLAKPQAPGPTPGFPFSSENLLLLGPKGKPLFPIWRSHACRSGCPRPSRRRWSEWPAWPEQSQPGAGCLAFPLTCRGQSSSALVYGQSNYRVSS